MQDLTTDTRPSARVTDSDDVVAGLPRVAVGVGALSRAAVVAVARDGAGVELTAEAEDAVRASRKVVEALADDPVPHYGVSTGFGALANRHIPAGLRAELQRSLVRSHAAGSGPEVEREVVRAMQLLRLSTLATGRTGVRLGTARGYAALLTAGIMPVVAEYGSLGCSGDLAPLAACALALTGEGLVRDVDGVRRPAAEALATAGIEPVTLREKEGLALINGTDGMLGMLVLACHDLEMLLRTADITAAMSVEALLGTDAVFAADLQALRPHPGQAASAANLRALLAGSGVVASHRHPGCTRVQDAYSLRCSPQVHGAVRDTVAHAVTVAERELAAAVDNPVVLPDGRVESNGNFHGAPVAYVLDFLAIAVADLAGISERRTDRHLDVARSHGLPAFLADDAGVDSGYMIAQYTQAALVSELKRLAVPASVDSIPSSAMQEDHVSMGWSAARKLRQGGRRADPGDRDRAAHRRPLAGPAPPAGARARDGGRPGGAAHHRAGAGSGPASRPGDRRRRRFRRLTAGADRRGVRYRAPRMKGARPVRAARGTTLTARSWQTEAPLRMLQNNLDPDVAERPDDLVVYGGTGRAARDWASFDALVRSLTTLESDETLLVQSGRPIGVLRTHEWAPRVLIANSNLVGDWANWPEFRRLERLGLTMYGQMTAGSWIYIGTQGILQGTYETFAAVADKRFGGSLRGTLTVTGGCGGMGGAQPLAVTLNGGVCLVVDVSEWRLRRRVEQRYLDELAADLGRRRRAVPAREGRGGGGVGRAGRQLRIGAARAAAARGRDRRGHRPDLGARPAGVPARRRRRGRLGRLRPAPSPTSSPTGRGSRWPGTSRRWSGSSTAAPRCSTTATRSATRPARAATTGRSPSPASSRPTSGRCSARGRGRSGGRRSPATRRTSR